MTRPRNWCAEGGFDAFKLRLGRDKLEDDLLAISQVCAAVGSDAKLMVDFNQGLTLGDAIRRCHALDDLRLYWFEEPTTYNNLEGYALLARDLRTPLQLGENFYGPRELYRAVTMQAGDYVMPDMMRIGGVSGWLRSVPIAAAAGIEVWSRRTSIRESRRTSCGSRRRRIGWSGRTGQTRS